jgi:hypothetical protein
MTHVASKPAHGTEVPEILTLRIPEILSHPTKSVRGRTLPYLSGVCEPGEGGGGGCWACLSDMKSRFC